MGETNWGVFTLHLAAFSKHPDIFMSSSHKFTALRHKMVGNPVRNAPNGNILASAIPPCWLTVYVPDLRKGFFEVSISRNVSNTLQLTVFNIWRGKTVCAP